MTNTIARQGVRTNPAQRKNKKRRYRIRPEISFAVFITGIIFFIIGIVNISATSSAIDMPDETGKIVAENPQSDGIVTEIPVSTANISANTAIYNTVSTTPIAEETSVSEPVTHYKSLGEFRLTAYCSCEKCCGQWGANRPLDENGKPIVYTASGKIAQAGYTIAADKSIYPFGTILYINGQPYEVQDVGGAIKGNKIDIYFDNHQDALNFGVQYAEVFVEVSEEG